MRINAQVISCVKQVFGRGGYGSISVAELVEALKLFPD